MNVNEVISQKALIDYSRAYQLPGSAFGALFPTRRVDGLEYDFILGAYNRPVSAHFHAFDARTERGQRYGYSRSTQSLEFIKRAYDLNEREIMMIRTPRTTREQQYAIDYIYDDITKLRLAIETRVERMRAEVLSTGKLILKENGYEAATIDFGVPTNHMSTVDWKDQDADILDDLFKFKKIIKDDSETDTEIARGIISENTLFHMLRNKSLRSGILGLQKDRILTQAELNNGLRAMGLPTFTTDDRKYAEEQIVNGKLIRTNKRFIDEDKIILIPNGTLGETIRGTTPEALELKANGVANVDDMGDITLTSWRDVDPVKYHVKASSTAGISFPYANEVYIANNNAE